MNATFKVAAIAAALSLSMGAKAEIIIDLFSTDQAQITDNSADDTVFAWSSVSTAGDDILGGERDLIINQIAQDGTTDPDINARLGVSSGRLAYSNDTGSKSIAEVQWDGDDGSADLDATGLNNVDLTMGGTLNAFLVETISSDADWNFEVWAYTDADNYTVISFAATEVKSGTGPVLSTISFDGFYACGLGPGVVDGVNSVTCVGTGVDLTNLGALRLVLNTGFGSQASAFDIDLRLGSITTIPEPGVLALMGMGLLAAGFAGRRKSKA
ncbi:MAG: PEP-CTERM sorting domain-containing protein [Halopseudomonas sp.]